MNLFFEILWKVAFILVILGTFLTFINAIDERDKKLFIGYDQECTLEDINNALVRVPCYELEN